MPLDKMFLLLCQLSRVCHDQVASTYQTSSQLVSLPVPIVPDERIIPSIQKVLCERTVSDNHAAWCNSSVVHRHDNSHSPRVDVSEGLYDTGAGDDRLVSERELIESCWIHDMVFYRE
jgi:hypothetical protein